MSVVTKTLIKVKIFVDDIDAIIADFDQIEVWRSVASSGPWEPVAVNGGPTSASVIGDDRQEPFQLNGRTLEVEFNGITKRTASFTGADPYSGASAVADIDAAITSLGSSSVTDGSLKITTTSTGNGASVQVTGGDYTNAGYQLDDCGLGYDAPVDLVPGQQAYVCEDHNGHASYWYRTRYRNSVSAEVSEYSVPFPATSVQKLDPASLITGTCHLVDLRGNALVGQMLTIHNLLEPSISGGYGILGGDLYLTTDSEGYCSTTLVRGSLVEVAFSNTPVRRRIRVPTDPTLEEFDFLDGDLAEDEFGIQVPNIRLAERRSP